MDSLRRHINKTELDPVLEGNQEKDRIFNAIFDDINSYPYQYFLKKNIITISCLIDSVSEIDSAPKLIQQIRKTFLINDDLLIPPRIKQIFVENEPVAFFIGAGLSALDQQVPTWPALGNQAVDYLVDREILTHHEADRLKSTVSDPKQKISILHNMLNFDSGDVKNFYELRFKKKTDDLGEESVYQILTKFRDVLKLTSNIDNLICLAEEAYKEHKKVSLGNSEHTDEQEPLDNFFNEKEDVVSEGFNKDMLPLKVKKIYFLHGYINNLKSVVMSTDQYAEAYYHPGKPERRQFLAEVFNQYTVIFMGYGLGELEILGNLAASGNKQHYALMPTYFNESYLFRLEKSYLNSFNIEPIPYYLDFNKYARIKTVLQNWRREIEEARTEEQIEGLQLIKEVIDAEA